MVESSSWYTLLDENEVITQGELVKDCSVIIPPKKLKQKRYTLDGKIYDVIVMSQTCDIEHSKIDYILVCPYHTLSSLEEFTIFRDPIGKEVLRRGNVNGYHLLNKCEISGLETDFLVVNFTKVFSVYKDFLINVIKSQDKRNCLVSPYREQLSQAFARYFMRIGLPKDIPPFADDVYKIE